MPGQRCPPTHGAGFGSGGSAILLSSGTLTLENSSFTNNYSVDTRYGVGGAIKAAGPLVARNCTLASNFANTGGALFRSAGGTLQNCTVANNAASTSAPAPGAGGGIVGSVTLESTIVSNNNAYNYTDISGTVTAKNSAIGNSSGITSFTDLGGNLPLGTNLQFNPNGTGGFGGDVYSVAPLSTSSAPR